ncbi:MAG: hypothetical protein OXN83_05275 [Oligoflexia bacterium]|nr:hypothetical protein [Oligoflexia bacterium]
MEILTGLIQTLALDYSFFYHLVLAFVLFSISKKWLFQPYISAMNQRRNFTKGRLEKSEDLELKIQKNKGLYDKKAKKIHKEFQKLFNKIRDNTLAQFSKDSLKLETDQKHWFKREKTKLQEAADRQNRILENEIPQLKEVLLNKIKS